jgi:hypothetical protein
VKNSISELSTSLGSRRILESIKNTIEAWAVDVCVGGCLFRGVGVVVVVCKGEGDGVGEGLVVGGCPCRGGRSCGWLCLFRGWV